MPWEQSVASLANAYLGIDYLSALKTAYKFTSIGNAIAHFRSKARLLGADTIPWNRENIYKLIGDAKEMEQMEKEDLPPPEVPQIRSTVPDKVSSANSAPLASAGQALFANQRKNGPTVVGPYGARQINRRFTRVKRSRNARHPKYRTSFNIGSENSPIIFMPWHPECIFQDFFPNHMTVAQQLDTGAWKRDDPGCTIANLSWPEDWLKHVNQTEEDLALAITAPPEKTAIPPRDELDWDPGEVIPVYVEEISLRGFINSGAANLTCRLLVYEIFDDYQRQFHTQKNTNNVTLTYCLSDFFEYDRNTTLHLANGMQDNRGFNMAVRGRPFITYESYNIIKKDPTTPIKYKVLADQTFMLPAENVNNGFTDRPFHIKYKPGRMEWHPHAESAAPQASGMPNYRPRGKGRIVWGFFVQNGGAADGVNPNPWLPSIASAAAALPTYYGTFKMKWRVLEDQ